MYFDTGANAVKYCNGTSWAADGSAAAAGSTGYVQFNGGSGALAGSAPLLGHYLSLSRDLGTPVCGAFVSRRPVGADD